MKCFHVLSFIVVITITTPPLCIYSVGKKHQEGLEEIQDLWKNVHSKNKILNKDEKLRVNALLKSFSTWAFPPYVDRAMSLFQEKNITA